nr:uncharacterized protein LOC123845790 [Mirounga angustirostris]
MTDSKQGQQHRYQQPHLRGKRRAGGNSGTQGTAIFPAAPPYRARQNSASPQQQPLLLSQQGGPTRRDLPPVRPAALFPSRGRPSHRPPPPPSPPGPSPRSLPAPHPSGPPQPFRGSLRGSARSALPFSPGGHVPRRRAPLVPARPGGPSAAGRHPARAPTARRSPCAPHGPFGGHRDRKRASAAQGPEVSCGRKPRCSARWLPGVVVPGQAPRLALRRRRALWARERLRYRVRPPGQGPCRLGPRSAASSAPPANCEPRESPSSRAAAILPASRRQTWCSPHPGSRQAPSVSETPFAVPALTASARARHRCCVRCGARPALFRQLPGRCPQQRSEKAACGVLPSRIGSPVCRAPAGVTCVRPRVSGLYEEVIRHSPSGGGQASACV